MFQKKSKKARKVSDICKDRLRLTYVNEIPQVFSIASFFVIFI